MMRRALGSGLAVVTLCLASGCNLAEMKEFSPDGGNFKVIMPGSPKEDSKTVLGITMKMYSVENSDGAMVVGYADLPINDKMTYATMHSRLDGAVKGMVLSSGGTLKSSTRVYLEGKNPGREVLADVPAKSGIMKARIYIVGRRLYQQLVVGVPSFVNSDDATKFLDSLSLISK